MKSYRSVEMARNNNNDKYTKYMPIERKGHSPTNAQNKMGEYDQLARKAKEQLR